MVDCKIVTHRGYSAGSNPKGRAKLHFEMDSVRYNPVFRFGSYEVSFQSGEVRKGGMRIKVQQQPLKVLEILLERPGEVVTRETLRTRVWAGEEFGDFDQAVNIAIGKLRTALGDSAENPRFIETVPKRGYRFIADVSVVSTATALQPAEAEVVDPVEPELAPPALTENRMRKGWRSIALLALLVTLSLCLIWFYLARFLKSSKIQSIAVLPLESLSGDESQDYFADGMTDELITNLAQISALRVISRTSVMVYKRARKPLPEIARELNVDAVVEGTVVQAGDRVRITAQLIQVPADKHLWAESYEGNVRDTLALQNRVARAIAEQIRIKLTPREQAALDSGKPVNPDAYEEYLKGRYFWNKRTADGLQKAKDHFNQAIAIDSGFAAPYSGLADAYALLGDWQYAVMTTKEALPKAKAAAQRALQLDDSLSEAHISLAFCLEGYDWNWAAADKEFRRGIELNPGYATGHHWYAWHLSLMGRNNEAIAEMKKAESLDPLSLIINADLAELLLIAHDTDESIEQSRKTIDMDPNFALARNHLAQAYMQKNMLREAIAELQKANDLSGGSPTITANLARAYALSNRKEEALSLLGELRTTALPGRPHTTEVASIYAALGDKDRAMDWLEKGYVERLNPGSLLRPGFDSLRSDPRFQDLRRRIGLPL
jgi:TolB-like protein/DNA-binding winged helix-turn-helix (wHTH) protein/Flp pilus assembly protein TadD